MSLGPRPPLATRWTVAAVLTGAPGASRRRWPPPGCGEVGRAWGGGGWRGGAAADGAAYWVSSVAAARDGCYVPGSGEGNGWPAVALRVAFEKVGPAAPLYAGAVDTRDFPQPPRANRTATMVHKLLAVLVAALAATTTAAVLVASQTANTTAVAAAVTLDVLAMRPATMKILNAPPPP